MKNNPIADSPDSITMHILLVVMLVALLAYIAIEVHKSNRRRMEQFEQLHEKIDKVEKRQDYSEGELERKLLGKIEEARMERNQQLRDLSAQIFELAKRGNE